MPGSDQKPEINCSHVLYQESIKQKEASIRDEKDVNVPAFLAECYNFWKDFQVPTFPAGEKTPEYIVSNIKEKITEVTEIIQNHLVSRGVIKDSEEFSIEELTKKGLVLFKDDLFNRSGTKFIEEIPHYVRKFLDYVILIDELPINDQVKFLSQFPPNLEEEYQCNGGATKRLDDVFRAAKGAEIIVNSHDLVTEDAAAEFRRNIYAGYHPHVESFLQYLTGVDKALVESVDNMYLTPRNEISVKQFYDFIINYNDNLGKSYINLLKGNKKGLIERIVNITNKDNENSLKGMIKGEEVFREKAVKEALMSGLHGLDIEEPEGSQNTITDEVISEIRGYFERTDSNNNVSHTFWLSEYTDQKVKAKFEEEKDGYEYKDGYESEESSEEIQDIRSVLEAKIDDIISRKSNYFERVAKERKQGSLPNNIIAPSNVKDIEDVITIFLESDAKKLTQKEEQSLHALRVLAEKLVGSNPIHFLVASDCLVGNKELLLEKLGDDVVMKGCVNHIYEMREVYLGLDDKDKMVKDLYPVFYKILHKDVDDVLESFTEGGGRLRHLMDQKFTAANDPENSYSVHDLLLQINDKNFVLTILNNLNKVALKELFQSFFDEASLGELERRKIRGTSFLHLAAERNDIEIIEAFLESDNLSQYPGVFEAIVCRSDEKGNTAFNLAAKNGFSEIVKVFLESEKLLQYPPDLKLFNYVIRKNTADNLLYYLEGKSDRYGCSALQSAVKNNHIEVVKVFLESKKLFQTRTFQDSFQKSTRSWHGVIEGNAIQIAVAQGNVEMVRLFLDSDKLYDLPYFFASTAGTSKTFVDLAIENGRSEIVEEFLESRLFTEKPTFFLKEGPYGNKTSLVRAVEQGNIKTIRLLLENEILSQNLDFFKSILRAKETALVVAAERGNSEIVELFLENKTLSQNPDILKDFLGIGSDKTALCAASSRCHMETLKAILENETLSNNPDLFKDLLSNSFVSLVDAAANNHTETVKFLLENNKILQDSDLLQGFLSAKDSVGRPALYAASHNGHSAIVELFLENEVISKDPNLLNNLLNSKRDSGETALDAAINNKNEEIVGLLLKKGAIISSHVLLSYSNKVNLAERNSESLINIVREGGNLGDLMLEMDSEQLKEAINVSVYTDFLHNKHRTPLQFASENGDMTAVRFLIENGANVNVVNNQDRTAFDYSIKGRNQDVCSYLMAQNIIDSDGEKEEFLKEEDQGNKEENLPNAKVKNPLLSAGVGSNLGESSSASRES